MFKDILNPGTLNLISGYNPDQFNTHGQTIRRGMKTYLDDVLQFDLLLSCDNACDGVFEKNVLEFALNLQLYLDRNETIFEERECNKQCSVDCFLCIEPLCPEDCSKLACIGCRALNDMLISDRIKKKTLTDTRKWASVQDFDNTISLLFGNGTTPGQVCAYNKALSEKKVTDITGFCCLDLPFESVDWGEKVGL